GYFDRVFLPGVSFVLVGGGDDPDKGKLVPNMKNIRKVAYVTSYGGDRLRTILMGDPPRRLARRWAWAMFGTPLPPRYLAFYDMNNATPERLKAFIAKVRREMLAFRSEEHTSELQSRENLVCRLLLEKKNATHDS